MPDFDRFSKTRGATSATSSSIQLRMPSQADTSAKITYVHSSVLIDQAGPFQVRPSWMFRLCTSSRFVTTAIGWLPPENTELSDPSATPLTSFAVSYATRHRSMKKCSGYTRPARSQRKRFTPCHESSRVA
jgi:hypothetical protein